MKKIICFFITALIMLFAWSCEKEELEKRDILIRDISGDYYLVSCRWSGPAIDINDDGECQFELYDLFWNDNSGFKLSASTKGEIPYHGSLTAQIPVTIGSKKPLFCGMSLLSGSFYADNSGIIFPKETINLSAPDNSSTKVSNPIIKFYRCKLNDEGDVLKEIFIICDACLYDFRTEENVEGQISFHYVSGPNMSITDGKVTITANNTIICFN